MKQFWDWYKGRVWIPILFGVVWMVLAFVKMPGPFDVNGAGITALKLRIIFGILGPLAVLLSAVGVFCALFSKKLENSFWPTAAHSTLMLACAALGLYSFSLRDPSNIPFFQWIVLVPLLIGCAGFVSILSAIHSRAAFRIYAVAALILHSAIIAIYTNGYFHPTVVVGRPRRRFRIRPSSLPSAKQWTLP